MNLFINENLDLDTIYESFTHKLFIYSDIYQQKITSLFPSVFINDNVLMMNIERVISGNQRIKK